MRTAFSRGPAALCFLAAGLLAGTASADGSRSIEFQFTPTSHAQLALWVEAADGTFL